MDEATCCALRPVSCACVCAVCGVCPYGSAPSCVRRCVCALGSSCVSRYSLVRVFLVSKHTISIINGDLIHSAVGSRLGRVCFQMVSFGCALQGVASVALPRSRVQQRLGGSSAAVSPFAWPSRRYPRASLHGAAGRARMRATEPLARHTQRLATRQRLSGLKFAFGLQEQAEVVERGECSRMLTAEGLAPHLQRLAKQRLRGDEVALGLQQ
eukprot:scaffold11332_cov65-Phaeocystis_antarctica.AAC.2